MRIELQTTKAAKFTIKDMKTKFNDRTNWKISSYDY